MFSIARWYALTSCGGTSCRHSDIGQLKVSACERQGWRHAHHRRVELACTNVQVSTAHIATKVAAARARHVQPQCEAPRERGSAGVLGSECAGVRKGSIGSRREGELGAVKHVSLSCLSDQRVPALHLNAAVV